MINQLVSQRYETLEKIGEGPLFTVYKARDTALNRIVALKAVAGAFARDRALLEGLERGLEASANLTHPNITHFYEWGEDGDTVYATVEFVRGINLRERIRRIAPFTLSVAVDVAVSLAEALQYAHSQGQVHGDLRPHNVIVSPEGLVKLTDFGVMAGVVESPRAQADVLARSAIYHAPELSMKQPGSVAGDIYALGAVLYEMLTGTPLYAGDSLDAIADHHAFSPIPLPRVINPGVPRSVEGIIVKCLQKQPDARYRSAGEALSDLKSVRDALRFGKPLSWSPVDVDKLANDVPQRRGQGSGVRGQEEDENIEDRRQKAAAVQSKIENRKSKIEEPVATAAASSQAMPMPANNRLRKDDERVSILLKIPIGILAGVIIALLIALGGIKAALWIEPEPIIIPKLVGKSIDEVRLLAQQKKLHLIEHAVYNAQPRGLVFKTDEVAGIKLKQGQDFNIWYSKGLTYVPVPNVVGLPRDEAEQKIKDAGLTVGKVTPEYSDTVAVNSIISQNISFKKTVLHDTAVGLIVSDGPKSDYGTDPNAEADSNTPAQTETPSNGNPIEEAAQTPDPDVNPNPPDDPANNESHEFRRVIQVHKDGLGKRKVRVEFVDANGRSIPPVVDDMYDENARIPLNFTYYGKKIILRVYYNDQLSLNKTFDPAAKQSQDIR